VFFISLVATSFIGFPEREHYLYDIATEMEFQGFRVKFLSAKEIKDFYRKYHPHFDKYQVTVYEMMQFFIYMNKGSSFFLDEVPFISLEYDYMIFDASSAAKLENFLYNCRKGIVDGKLWIALQANALSDACNTGDGFEKSFEKIKTNLEKIFTFPDLSKNMRNSGNINSAGQGVQQSNAFDYQVSNAIEKLPPPTISSSQEKPLLIPIKEKDFEFNFKNMLNEEVFNPKKKTLILHSKKFKGNDLKSLFRKKFPEIKPETILHHDDHPNDAAKEELQDFLKDPEIKIGIFQSKFVTGMEGSNVIYFYDENDLYTSPGCTMTRAVSHLCIILRFTDNGFSLNFKNTKLIKKFIKCKKMFETLNSYKCLTCNTNQICKTCCYGCHHEHEIDFEGFDENEKCKCRKTKCLIQKPEKRLIKIPFKRLKM